MFMSHQPALHDIILISLPTGHFRSHRVDSFPSTMFLNAHSDPHFGVGAEPWQDLLESIAVHLVRKPPGQRDKRRKELDKLTKYISNI